jgi:hypothetical protein
METQMSKIVETPKELALKVNELRAQAEKLRENGLPVGSIKTQILELQAKIKRAQADQIVEKIKRVNDPRKADAKAKIELGGLFIVAGIEAGTVDPAVLVGGLIELEKGIVAHEEAWRAAGLARLTERAKLAAARREAAKKPRKSAPAVADLANLGG